MMKSVRPSMQHTENLTVCQGCPLSHLVTLRTCTKVWEKTGKDGNFQAIFKTHSTSHCPTLLSTAWSSPPPGHCPPLSLPGLPDISPQCPLWAVVFLFTSWILLCPPGSATFSSVLTSFHLLSVGKVPNFHLYDAETSIFISKQISLLSSNSFLAINSQTTPKCHKLSLSRSAPSSSYKALLKQVSTDFPRLISLSSLHTFPHGCLRSLLQG